MYVLTSQVEECHCTIVKKGIYGKKSWKSDICMKTWRGIRVFSFGRLRLRQHAASPSINDVITDLL